MCITTGVKPAKLGHIDPPIERSYRAHNASRCVGNPDIRARLGRSHLTRE